MSSNPLNQTAILEETQTFWGSPRKPAGCPHCRRVFLIPADLSDVRCPLCKNESLEDQPARLRLLEPEWLLPFRVNKPDLPKIYEAFISGVWIKPEDMTAETLLKRSQAVFWPLWLVDCDVVGQWQMEAGFDYQVESTKETFSNGQWLSKKVVEDRTRWEPRAGEVNTHVDNVTAPALEDRHNREQMTGQYPLDQARNYDPQSVAQSIIEVPDLPPDEAWPLAKPQVNKALGALCAKAASAQHHRNFAIRATYQRQHWTQFLLPMFSTYYLDDEGKPQVLIVNGYNGRIQGPRLASQRRGLQMAGILTAIACGLLLLAVIGILLTAIFPPAGIIGGLLGVLGLGVGIGAIVFAVWPAQWNRNQGGPRIISRKP